MGDKQGVAAFTDVVNMLDSGLVDAITVATPSAAHQEPVIAALERNIPVLCEKPIEITTDRIDDIIEAESTSKAFAAAIFQVRFYKVIQKMKSFIDDNGLGEIYHGSVYIKLCRTQAYYDSSGWRGAWEFDGGGCLMNQGIHQIDLLQWLLGRPTEVIALVESKGKDVEVETLASALVRFESGATGVIEATMLAYPGYEPYLELIGSKGTAAFSANRLIHMGLANPTEKEASIRDELMGFTRDGAESATAAITKSPGPIVTTTDMGHAPVLEDFIEAIRSRRPPSVTTAEARESVAFITAIYKSSHTGVPVSITPRVKAAGDQ